MGIFLNKIIKPLFRSKKGNWISRINEMTDKQLNIISDLHIRGSTHEENLIKESDLLEFIKALDGIVDLIDNWDILLESVKDFYIKFDIKTARPIHKIALKNPEKLSEDEKLRFLDEVGILVLSNMMRRHKLITTELCRPDSLGILMGSFGMVFYPEVRKKGYLLWSHLENCFSMCKKFKYQTHLPKSFIELLKNAELKK
jgi:hypothetical protein